VYGGLLLQSASWLTVLIKKPISADYADICIDKLMASAGLSFVASARSHVLHTFSPQTDTQ
jgi:hypothetical protein